MNIRVLQTSDLHLGAGVLPLGHGFDLETVHRREAAAAAILEKIVDIARREDVRLVLIPGDLWDQELVSHSLVRRVLDALQRLGDIPVVIVPGNHDFLSSESPYRENVAARQGMEWPHNVHVVTQSTFTRFQLPALPGVSFTAMAAGADLPTTERLLADDLPRAEDCLNILLFHGSRQSEGFVAAGGDNKVTAPFTDEELLAAEFDYTALGHYHSHLAIRDEEGKIRAAYSGSPISRDFKTSSAKGVLLFDLEPGGVPESSFRFITTDESRYLQIKVDLSGAAEDKEAEKKILDALNENGVEKKDLVRLHLTGSFGIGPVWRPALDTKDLALGVEYVGDNLRVGFDLEEELRSAPSGTALAVFLARFKEMIEEQRSSSEPDSRRLEVLRAAARLGFEAFRGDLPVISAEPVRFYCDTDEQSDDNNQ